MPTSSCVLLLLPRVIYHLLIVVRALVFFYPGGCFGKAARRCRLANIRRRAPGVTSVPPCSPLHPSHVASYRLIVVWFFFFVNPEEGGEAVFSSPAPPSNQISAPGVRGQFRDPLHFQDAPHTSPPGG